MYFNSNSVGALAIVRVGRSHHRPPSKWFFPSAFSFLANQLFLFLKKLFLPFTAIFGYFNPTWIFIQFWFRFSQFSISVLKPVFICSVFLFTAKIQVWLFFLFSIFHFCIFPTERRYFISWFSISLLQFIFPYFLDFVFSFFLFGFWPI